MNYFLQLTLISSVLHALFEYQIPHISQTQPCSVLMMCPRTKTTIVPYGKPPGQSQPYHTCLKVYIQDMLPPEVNIWAQDMAGIVQSAVTAEAAQVFGENAQVACIVSIGTGHSVSAGHVGSDASRKRLPYILTKNIKRMAADSEKVAAEKIQKRAWDISSTGC